MQKHKSRLCLIIIFALITALCFTFFAYAETIILKSGKKIEGKIVEKTNKYIKVDVDGVAFTYLVDAIESIDGDSSYIYISNDNLETPLSEGQATTMSNNGLMLIKDGKWEEGLGLMKQAKDINPQDGSLHMNYASMLFMKGQKMHEAGNKNEATPIFKEAEEELNLAILSFKDKDNALKSHCSFLLGDIYFYVYADTGKAKEFYKKAVEYYPQHEPAVEALKKINSLN